MQFTRQLSLATYYYGSQPLRWWRAERAARERRAPVMVLFYHRIADSHPNPWTMRADDFARQIDWLERHFDLVSLAEAQARIRTHNPRPAVAITFDDGYADNCHFALPLLVKRRIPVMYFVTTQHILHGEPFPHDVARGQPLQPNTLDELRALAAQGVEIGAHTRSHANLGAITDNAVLLDEVVTASEELQAAIGCPLRYFAFPFGQHANLNTEVFHLAYDAGFEGVCSAYGGYNFPGDDAFHLQRFHADPNLLRLKNWLTVDPRWLHQPRFAYERALVSALPQEATA